MSEGEGVPLVSAIHGAVCMLPWNLGVQAERQAHVPSSTSADNAALLLAASTAVPLPGFYVLNGTISAAPLGSYSLGGSLQAEAQRCRPGMTTLQVAAASEEECGRQQGTCFCLWCLYCLLARAGCWRAWSAQ